MESRWRQMPGSFHVFFGLRQIIFLELNPCPCVPVSGETRGLKRVITSQVVERNFMHL